jgi:pSer/pThr/pTyr-binding forkhead associated (FHA) protein
MAQLILKYNDSEMGSWPIGDTPLIVGRAAHSQIYIESPAVAENHCLIEKQADGVYITDMGSSTGTLVNGERVQRHQLKHEDVITVGTYTITYIGLDTVMIAAAKEDTESFGETIHRDMTEEDGLDKWTAKDWHLTIEDEEGKRNFELRKPDYSMGSDPECDIMLFSKKAEPTHAVLVLDDMGMRIIDTSDKRGFTLNNKPAARREVLSAGDIIMIGKHKITIVQK